MLESISQLFIRVVIGFLLNTVCFYVGWFICKIVTFGKYPNELPHEEGLVSDYIFGSIVTFVGLITILGVSICVLKFL